MKMAISNAVTRALLIKETEPKPVVFLTAWPPQVFDWAIDSDLSVRLIPVEIAVP